MNAYCEKAEILVSVSPYVKIVQSILPEETHVSLLVPQGASFHSYEPTPQAMLQATKAKIWFSLGDPFEEKVKNFLLAHNPHIKIIDLSLGLNLLEESCHTHHDHHSHDPHIWTSPKMMIEQVKKIQDVLLDVFPDKKDEIEKNCHMTILDLNHLDEEIRATLKGCENMPVLVVHPSYGYFCREFDLVQYSIEFEGKEPSMHRLSDLVKKAQELGIKTVYGQKQYSNKSCSIIAKMLHAKLIILDPYSDDYFNSMLQIAKSFSESTVEPAHEE